MENSGFFFDFPIMQVRFTEWETILENKRQVKIFYRAIQSGNISTEE